MKSENTNQLNIKLFQEKGYIVFKNVLQKNIFSPIKKIINKVVDKEVNELKNSNRIKYLYKNYGFKKRWYKALSQNKISNDVFGWHSSVFSKELFNLLNNSNILDSIGIFLDNEIQFNGDFWIRPKLPEERITTLPWHQDSAYMPETENDLYLTVWIPLVDVNQKNGALQFIPGTHKNGLIKHENIINGMKTPEKDPSLRKKTEILSMNVGDILVFHNLVFHRSLINKSNIIRWSIDFRYSHVNTSLYDLWHKDISCILRSNNKRKENWSNWENKWNLNSHKNK